MDIREHPVKTVALGAAGLAAGAAIVGGARFSLGIKTAVSQGGSPWGGTVNWWLARRGVIKFGMGRALHGPGEFRKALTIKKAEEFVRVAENRIFYEGATQVGKKIHIGYDNGPDAFRHTGASALITYRLMSQHGASASDAAELLRQVGNAHERDSFLHVFDEVHMRMSGLQDVHNNTVGAEMAVAAFGRHAELGHLELSRMADEAMRDLPQPMQDVFAGLDAGEQLVMADVLRGIEQGRSVSMTPVPGTTVPANADVGIHNAPRPTVADDIYVTAPDGTRSVRTMQPHATGYPQPFRDGKYDPDLPRVRMDLKALFRKRPEVAQG